MLSQLPKLLISMPFLRLVGLLGLGIIFQYWLNLSLVVYLILAAFLIIFIIALQLEWLPRKLYLIFCRNVVYHVLVFILGALAVISKNYSLQKHAALQKIDATTITGEIIAAPEHKENSLKLLVQLQYGIANKNKQALHGKAYVYLPKTTATNNLPIGSSISFKNNLNVLKNLGNPGGFDYKKYCERIGVYYQAYLKPNEFIITPSSKGFKIANFLAKTRTAIITTLKKYISDSTNAGLAEALIIGYKDDLDKNIVQSYTNTGAVHVIAISGMHVGIIYFILQLLLAPIFKKPAQKKYKIILQIVLIWLFALLAGASPSILRSAIMFSIIAAQQFFTNRQFTFNSLFASAFILLVYNPFLLWDVGFQLSYAAVLSILIFYKPIGNWFTTPYKWVNYIWKLQAVTLAAQILTLPITIYHFHQFPNYFLLANALIVPLSSIIVIGILILLVLQFVPILASLLGKILNACIIAMNKVAQFFEQLPYALADYLQITIVETILLYATIGLASIALLKKHKKAFIASAICLLIVSSLHTIVKYITKQKDVLMVLNANKHSFIGIKKGGQLFAKQDSSLQHNSGQFNFFIKPTLGYFASHNLQPLQGNNWWYRNKWIALFNQQQKPSLNSKASKIIILQQNAKEIFAALPQLTKNDIIVADASNSNYFIKKLDTACKQQNIVLHNVALQGAFIW
jgi:competence protein ComEC